MVQYFTPGVYVEEIDAGPKPIQGVSTSVTGMAGVTLKGPADGKPLLVTSFAEFVRVFGGFMNPPADGEVKAKWSEPSAEGGYWWRFAYSVKGFFDNGGRQLFVKRIMSKKARSSATLLGSGLICRLLEDSKPGARRIKLESFIGIKKDTEITFIDGKLNTPIGVKNKILSYNTRTGWAKLERDTPNLSGSRGDLVQVKERTAPSAVTAANCSFSITAKNKGADGDNISVSILPAINSTNRIILNPAEPPSEPSTFIDESTYKTSLTLKDSTIAVLKDDLLKIGEIVCKVTDLGADKGHYTVASSRSIPPTALPVEGISTPGYRNTLAETKLEEITLKINDLRSLKIGSFVNITDFDYQITGVDSGAKLISIKDPYDFDDFNRGEVVKPISVANLPDASNKNKLYVSSTQNLYNGALVELDNKINKELVIVKEFDGKLVTFTNNLNVKYLEGSACRVIESTFRVLAQNEQSQPIVEEFGPIRLQNDGSSRSITKVVNNQSNLVKIEFGSGILIDDFSKFPCPTSGIWSKLVGGSDAVTELSVDDFVGEDGGSGKRTGVQAFEDLEDISLVAVPGMWSPTIRNALLAHCEHMRYRMAILDPLPNLSNEEIRNYRAEIDSKRAALYHPWLSVRDPLSGGNVPVPPSGHTAGVYARVDAERGVHKAPANEILLNINGLGQDITTREQDLLNPKGINVLRRFPDRGDRIWGARTVSSDPTWRYVNVRRIFNFIERSIEVGMQWVVFEPNDENLWSRVRQTIVNFLTTQWRAGMLEGKTAAEAFYVACDRGVTMTQTDIENGYLVCEVGIAPVFPAEFVVFKIQKFTASSKVS